MGKLSEDLFAIKLYEMEQQYGRLQTKLRICSQEDHQQIRIELEQAKREYREKNLLLQQSIENGRSKAVSALAAAQLECQQKAEKLLNSKLPESLHSEANTQLEDEAEAAALYAEYAMDFSTQAMQYAFLSALRALDLQLDAEEQKEEHHHETD